MEQNPLEIKAMGIKTATNKRGRPINAHTIKFSSPQPKSAIIAQILREKSLKQSSESTSMQTWQCTESVDDDFHSPQEDVKEFEIKVEVVTENPKRSKTKKKSDEKPKKHIKIPGDKQEKQFPCDYPNCTYAAKLSCNLIKHKRRHTSEKPYICDQCPFRTNFINSLKVHRRIHTAEKPYNCECCGYRCNTSSNLKKHRMHRHPEVAKI